MKKNKREPAPPNPDRNPTKEKSPVREPAKQEPQVLASAGNQRAKVARSGMSRKNESPPTRPKKENTEMGMETEKKVSEPKPGQSRRAA